jgi:hypothetical protein
MGVRLKKHYSGKKTLMSHKTGFVHMVYFWLREGGDGDDAAKLAKGCRTFLTDIPGVLRLEVGFPAGTDRPVVDNSYGVALLVEFADSAAHDVYQEHSDHKGFIAECGYLWRRVQIYDTIPAA